MYEILMAEWYRLADRDFKALSSDPAVSEPESPEPRGLSWMVPKEPSGDGSERLERQELKGSAMVGVCP